MMLLLAAAASLIDREQRPHQTTKAARERLEQQLLRSPQLVAALRRGAAAAGDPSRLLRVLRDAEAGRAVELVGVGASLTGDFAGVIGRDQVERFRPHLLRPHLLRASPSPPSPSPTSPLLSPPRLAPPHHTQDKYAHMSCGMHTPGCRGNCVETGWLTELAQHLAGGVPLADSNVSVVNVGHPGNTFG
eukprot:scaffold66600_cov62-Phaeocystis_antarctica.AAC.1